MQYVMMSVSSAPMKRGGLTPTPATLSRFTDTNLVEFHVPVLL